MEERRLTDRALRVKEIYEEEHYHNVSEFARAMGLKQPTVANFFRGMRDPSNETLRCIADSLPKYNLKWLMCGQGDKYNSEIEPQQQNGHAQRSAYSSHEELLAKLTSAYERLMAYMNKCNDLEQQLREAKELIESFQKENTPKDN